MTSMHTRPKCSSNCLRHRLHGTSEAELRQFVSDAFLFYFICKRLRWSVKPLPPLCSTSLHWMEQAIIYVLYWAEGVIFLWETRSERPINATRHQQEAAQINIPPSIICLSKFCLSFCLPLSQVAIQESTHFQWRQPWIITAINQHEQILRWKTLLFASYSGSA